MPSGWENAPDYGGRDPSPRGWALLVALAALIVYGVVACHGVGVPLAAPAQEPPAPLRVIDGDTVEQAGVTYRIANIDTPETGDRARCPEERRLGEAATGRARALLADPTRVVITPDGSVDRYGRARATVAVDGRGYGDILMAEGLAQPWRGRRAVWCGRP